MEDREDQERSAWGGWGRGVRLCDSVKGDVTMAMSGQPDLNKDWQGLGVLVWEEGSRCGEGWEQSLGVGGPCACEEKPGGQRDWSRRAEGHGLREAGLGGKDRLPSE